MNCNWLQKTINILQYHLSSPTLLLLLPNPASPLAKFQVFFQQGSTPTLAVVFVKVLFKWQNSCLPKVVGFCLFFLKGKKMNWLKPKHTFNLYSSDTPRLGKSLKLHRLMFPSFTVPRHLQGPYRSMVLHVAGFADWLVIHCYIGYPSQNTITIKTAEVFQMPVLPFSESIFIAEY